MTLPRRWDLVTGPFNSTPVFWIQNNAVPHDLTQKPFWAELTPRYAAETERTPPSFEANGGWRGKMGHIR